MLHRAVASLRPSCREYSTMAVFRMPLETKQTDTLASQSKIRDKGMKRVKHFGELA